VRELAYLRTTPNKDYKPRTEKTRYEEMEKIGKEPIFPNIEGYEYLLHHLQTLGYFSSTGMGTAPLSFTEINSYMQATQTYLTPREVLAIRKLSENYIAEMSNDSPMAKHPHSINEETKVVVPTENILALFGGA